MAAKKSASGSAFIAKLVKNPARPPRLAVVQGFEGASAVRGHRRIYHRMDLSRWLDVPSRSIRHSVPTGGLGHAAFWIDAAATCSHGSVAMPAWRGKLAAAHPGHDAATLPRHPEQKVDPCYSMFPDTCWSSPTGYVNCDTQAGPSCPQTHDPENVCPPPPEAARRTGRPPRRPR